MLEDGTVLGSRLLAVNAGDLIAPIVLAMHNDLPISVLQEIILPYSTMVAAIRQAARNIEETQARLA